MTDRTVRIFASAVTAEFGSYRGGLVQYLTGPAVQIEEQTHFLRDGLPILTELDDYIQS